MTYTWYNLISYFYSITTTNHLHDNHEFIMIIQFNNFIINMIVLLSTILDQLISNLLCRPDTLIFLFVRVK